MDEESAHDPQEGIGAYCCGALPSGYNQTCNRGVVLQSQNYLIHDGLVQDLSPAVLYSSMYAMQRTLLKHG